MSDLNNLIIVDITDKENTQLDVNSALVSIKGNGTILTKNPSQQSRLWNCTNDLKEVVNTTIPDKVLNVGALNPGQEHKQEYEIQNLQAPCLKVVETFDTERGTGASVNNAFLYKNANKSRLTLTFTNTLDKPISDIISKREMPPMLVEIEINTPNHGKAELADEGGKRILLWEINSLGANETAEVQVTCTVNMEDRGKQSLGALKVTYVTHGHILTLMNPEVRSLTDSMSGVSRDEGSNPGTWDCNVEFINDSEFKVKLEDVKVDHKITTGVESIVTQSPNQEIGPQGSWDFDFNLETPDVPELNSAIIFTALFGVITKTIGEINKESTIYDVLAAEVHKAINPPEVGAYANTNMTIENKIPNTGTAAIDTLEIIDEVPKDFVPPEMGQIKLLITGADVPIEIQSRTEFVQNMALEPSDPNPDNAHTITITLKDLKAHLVENSTLTMSYPILAKNPKPEVRYNTPVQIKANTLRKGALFIISPSEEPVVKIKYIQRKLKTLKSIKPGMNEGEFNINVRVQNKGDVELENLIIKDKIPAGFSLSEYKPPSNVTYEIIQEAGESMLQIKMDELKGNDTLIINYICTGSGDYPRSEPQVNVLGRGGAAVKSGPTSEGSQEAAPEVEITHQKSAELMDLFSGIYKKLDAAIPVSDFASHLDSIADKLPPGPSRHKFTQFVRDLQAMPDQGKIIVGGIYNDIMAKLKDFENNY